MIVEYKTHLSWISESGITLFSAGGQSLFTVGQMAQIFLIRGSIGRKFSEQGFMLVKQEVQQDPVWASGGNGKVQNLMF